MKLINKTLIKKAYDQYVKATLNNLEITDYELEILDSKVHLAFNNTIYSMNEEHLLFDILEYGFDNLFLARLTKYIIKDHILRNGNKRLALAILFKMEKVDIFPYEISTGWSQKDWVQILKDIASDQSSMIDLVKKMQRVNIFKQDFFKQNNFKQNEVELKKIMKLLAKE